MFLINAVTFGAVLVSLRILSVDQLLPARHAPRAGGDLIGGFRYVAKRPDILVILVMLFLVGTFGLNFPIFVATMARVDFGEGAGVYGVLSSVMAIGSVTGALLSARREAPRVRFLLASAALVGVGCLAAAAIPTMWAFGLILVVVGVAAQTFMTTANALVQLATDAEVRGRVTAIFMAIFMGGTHTGAPIVGWVANTFGPRWSLGVGAASGFAAAAVGIGWWVRRWRADGSTASALPPREAGVAESAFSAREADPAQQKRHGKEEIPPPASEFLLHSPLIYENVTRS